MTSLLHCPAPVHSIAIVGLPETARHEEQPQPHHDTDLWFHERPDPEPEPEPFHPSPEDLAEDAGYRAGLAGGRCGSPVAWASTSRSRYSLGYWRGVRDAEARSARELGEALGYEEGPGEPPAGLLAHEKAAFRAGYAEGLARFEAEREYDAWVDERAAEAFVDGRITDADIYPAGCVS